MWWRLLLLCLYLATLVLLSRVLEAVTYLEGGSFASRLLDPVTLSVRRLQLLLDRRGVSYAGALEKRELTSLIKASGEVTSGELSVAEQAQEEPDVTTFTCATHFYEQVEDAADSVWVVQVARDGSSPFLPRHEWRHLMRTLVAFGVRVGELDCSKDTRLCERKWWRSPRLVLGVPAEWRRKDQVTLRSYTGVPRHDAVMDWVNQHLAAQIHPVLTYESLAQDWLRGWPTDKARSPAAAGGPPPSAVRVVLLTPLAAPPMFLSVLSVKFTGRVAFGIVTLSSQEGERAADNLRLPTTSPSLLVVCPEGNMTYGGHDALTARGLALLLHTMHPEASDVLVLSLCGACVCCLLSAAMWRAPLMTRLSRGGAAAAQWLTGILVLWLPALALIKLSAVEQLVGVCLSALRAVALTRGAALLRRDSLLWADCHPALLAATLLIFTLTLALIHHKFASHTVNNNTEWWNFNLSAATNYLFRPVMPPNAAAEPLDLEVGMDLLIERLAIPTLWLQPIINSDYMKDLPVWRHSMTVDVFSDGEGTKSDGEDPRGDAWRGPIRCYSADSVRPLPAVFECEKCRALQRHREETRSVEDLEEEQRSRESACAKFLMDGNYRCMCKAHCSEQRAGRPGGRQCPPGKPRARSMSPLPWSGDCLPAEELSEEEEWPAGMLEASECAICLEAYRHCALLCGLPCGHTFHQPCILSWLARDNHACPCCRWPTYRAKPCSRHSHQD